MPQRRLHPISPTDLTFYCEENSDSQSTQNELHCGLSCNYGSFQSLIEKENWVLNIS